MDVGSVGNLSFGNLEPARRHGGDQVGGDGRAVKAGGLVQRRVAPAVLRRHVHRTLLDEKLHGVQVALGRRHVERSPAVVVGGVHVAAVQRGAREAREVAAKCHVDHLLHFARLRQVLDATRVLLAPREAEVIKDMERVLVYELLQIGPALLTGQ